MPKKSIKFALRRACKFKICCWNYSNDKTINYKDKITLGIVYCLLLLKKINIDLYIDKIYVINRTEPETKDNSKPKSKSK